jgi:fructose-1-phosphate kinase PfkB-like protein
MSVGCIVTNVAQGVRFVWDFEVTSIEDLIRFAPDLVKIEPKRREIIAWLKGLEENEDRDASAIAAQVGIVAYKIPSISTR